MLFSLSTNQFLYFKKDVKRVQAYLRNGLVEVFNGHEDLMGNIDLNFVLVECESEGKTELSYYIAQEAIFLVSSALKFSILDIPGTNVCIFAKKMLEITSDLSYDDTAKEYELKKVALEEQNEQLILFPDKLSIITKILLLRDEVSFLKKLMILLKDKNFKP
jgi:hypothetical protein